MSEEPKSIFSRDHAEIVSSVWTSLDDSGRAAIYSAVAAGLGGVPKEGAEPRDVTYSDVVRNAWCLGFHYAMCAMEQGALVKVGQQNPGQN
jgi:hypothetical protein